jgi:hypothetical protein
LIVATQGISFGWSASAGLPRKVPTPRAQGKVRDVGDRTALTAEKRHDAEPLLEGGENPADLRAVAVQRVVVALWRKAHEMHVLSEHRADQRHLHIIHWIASNLVTGSLGRNCPVFSAS